MNRNFEKTEYTSPVHPMVYFHPTEGSKFNKINQPAQQQLWSNISINELILNYY
jgi:hypothetical protein